MARNRENNFKKAMNGLLGYGEERTKEPPREEPRIQPMEEMREELREEPREEFIEQPIIIEEEMEEELMEKSVKEPQYEVKQPERPSNGKPEALITEDMVINGNVTTKSNIKILGTVLGDIECEGDICLLGSIEGRVQAGNLTIQRGGLTGDAQVRENIVIEKDVMLKGNMAAKNISSNARSEGNFVADNVVELHESAIVQGDITAGELSVSRGAKIKGMVEVSE